MLQVLDAQAVRRWCDEGRAALGAARVEIDALNVYPVRDNDTGTNLLLTVTSVADALHALPDDLPQVADGLSRAALMGARGNSGAILSQLLRGLAEVLVDGPAGGAALARGLARGADLAYAGVAGPVEGTLLSVARAAADGAAAAGPSLADAVAAAGAAARAALARTPDQLPVLRDAGVVDAGGRGWVVLLEALARVVGAQAAPASAVPAAPHPAPPGAGGPAYEVQYLLSGATPAALDVLRGALARLGDSLVVVGHDDLHHVHVHVDDVGAAIEAGVEAGRPSRITVTRFADHAAAGRAVVAVCTGPGLGQLLRDAGAVVVLAPATPAQLLDAVRTTGAAQVVLLPGPTDPAPVVAGAAAQGTSVQVVRTRSCVQVLSALAVADAGCAFDDDVAAMQAAASATRTGEVVRAVLAATTAAGMVVPGDALGVLDGRVEVVGADVGWVAVRLLGLLAGDAELVTAVLGAGAPHGLGDRLREAAGDVELVVVDGGQQHPPVLLGAE